MSADNGLIIRINKAGKYVLQQYFASADDYPDLEGAKDDEVYDTLEEAVLAAAEFDTEYGLKIDLKKSKKEDPTKMETAKFVRKPFEVEAVQVTAENIEEVAAWCFGTVEHSGDNTLKDDRYISVRVQHPISARQTKAFIGDWVLYSGKGFKCYNPNAFKKNFVPAEEGRRPSVVSTADSPK